MNTLSTPADKQISGEDLITFPIEELEELLLQMYASLEKTFHTIRHYAQGATHIETPFLHLIELTNEYKQTWAEMKATVDALICHAIFADFNERQWNKLAQAVHEENAFLQAVTLCKDINSEWLTQRDTLVVQTASLLKDVPPMEIESTFSNKC